MFSYIRTQIDQLVNFLRPLSISGKDSGSASLCARRRRSYCSRSNTLPRHIKTPCRIRSVPVKNTKCIRERRSSTSVANATTGRERAVSFDSKVVRNLPDDDDRILRPPPSSDPMSVISSSDDEELLEWFSPNDSPPQKDPLPVSSER